MSTRFVVRRNDLHHTSWVDEPSTDLTDGAVRFRVDTFALTSNNITYAAFGDALGYWNFYPTGDPATGTVPVWGFADVTETRCAGVEVGERFYGYWPIADEVTLNPAVVNPSGFIEGGQHRSTLSPVYNTYVRCSADPGYTVELEAQQALLRPLFGTAFMLDDFLADNDFFGASTVVASSASSKTAYATAYCLARRGDARVIGLTSEANAEFTRSLGCYDDVLTYDDIPALSKDPSLYVDFSGSSAVRTAVHERLGAALRYSCAVGATHWDTLGSQTAPGPDPVLFFVPDHIVKRSADWGADGLRQRLGAAWLEFMEPVTRAENPWLTVVRGAGHTAVEDRYGALLGGTAPAREGFVLTV